MSKLSALTLGYHTLINSTITGFAGYGLANVGGSNAKLAATIGVIYGVAICLIDSVAHFISPCRTRAAFICRNNIAQTAIDAILIVAMRALGLIGNKGLACFAGIALTSHVIGHLNYVAAKQKEAHMKARARQQEEAKARQEAEQKV